MVQKGKINVKERFSDGEVDLSMSDLDEVPVKEIVALKKTTSLDLSNNRLTLLPKDFTVLINLTKLDLSKNELTELPEDFGSLSKLKYLDLYKNNLERLPLSFGQLNGLKFLDLKDNPLIPAIAKVAGPCVDTKGCQQCARDVVNFFRKLQEEVDNEVEMRKKARQKQLDINQQKKQEEKKRQKKEKQNNKPKKDIEKNDNKQVTTGKKQIKKEQKKNKTSKETSNAQGTAILSVLIILFSLFYLFNYRYYLVEPYIRFNKNVYKEFLNMIPNNAKYYVESFVNSLDFITEKINRSVLNFIQVLSNNDIIQAIIVKLREGVGGIVEKVVGKNE